MYRFRRFGLKLSIHAPFWGILGAYFRHMTLPIDLTPKRTVRGGHSRLNHSAQRKNGATVREIKDSTGYNKSHKSVIFPLFVGKLL